MLQVELDIFSGLPNPSWLLSDKEEKELLDRIAADPSVMLPTSATNGRLGYRGYVVTTVSESLDKKLPSSFRIGGQPGSASELSLWLLETSETLDTEVDDYLRDAAAGLIRLDEQTSRGATLADKGAGASCVSNHLTSSTDFSFWNGASYIMVNNCYNFASNYRSNTFAQPGRQSGHPFTPPPTCSKVATAIRWDGWQDSCQTSSNLSICLVIWPYSPVTGKSDFHFYRKCSGGLWCHKPGKTPAKNTDDSGNQITNPQTANRGPYTSFCEYFYVGGGSIVVN